MVLLQLQLSLMKLAAACWCPDRGPPWLRLLELVRVLARELAQLLRLRPRRGRARSGAPLLLSLSLSLLELLKLLLSS